MWKGESFFVMVGYLFWTSLPPGWSYDCSFCLLYQWSSVSYHDLEYAHWTTDLWVNWLIGWGCLDHRVAHIWVLDGAPRGLLATIIPPPPSSEGSSIDIWVNLRWWSLPESFSSLVGSFTLNVRVEGTPTPGVGGLTSCIIQFPITGRSNLPGQLSGLKHHIFNFNLLKARGCLWSLLQ